MVDRKISRVELKDAIAVALAAAFGFVIALIWKEVVMTALEIAGVTLDATGDWGDWAIFMVVAVILTVVMVVLIILITRWGKKPEE